MSQCPLKDRTCHQEACEWWLKYNGRCAVPVVANLVLQVSDMAIELWSERHQEATTDQDGEADDRPVLAAALRIACAYHADGLVRLAERESPEVFATLKPRDELISVAMRRALAEARKELNRD